MYLQSTPDNAAHFSSNVFTTTFVTSVADVPAYSLLPALHLRP